LFLQLCGWFGTWELWVGAISDTDYQVTSGIFKFQEQFTSNCANHSDLPFTNIMDKGYRCRLAAWRTGRQLLLRPLFARSDRKFNTREIIHSSAISAGRAANERAVNVSKRSGYLARGMKTHGDATELADAWLAWSLQINFMIKSQLCNYNKYLYMTFDTIRHNESILFVLILIVSDEGIDKRGEEMVGGVSEKEVRLPIEKCGNFFAKIFASLWEPGNAAPPNLLPILHMHAGGQGSGGGGIRAHALVGFLPSNILPVHSNIKHQTGQVVSLLSNLLLVDSAHHHTNHPKESLKHYVAKALYFLFVSCTVSVDSSFGLFCQAGPQRFLGNQPCPCPCPSDL
jgi:hypothetical protein